MSLFDQKPVLFLPFVNPALKWSWWIQFNYSWRPLDQCFALGVKIMVSSIPTYNMLLHGFYSHPSIVFAFYYMFPISCINFMQYCVQYREFLYQKVTISAKILVISSFMHCTATVHYQIGSILFFLSFVNPASKWSWWIQFIHSYVTGICPYHNM